MNEIQDLPDYGFWIICSKCDVKMVKYKHLESMICPKCNFKLTEEYLDSLPDE